MNRQTIYLGASAVKNEEKIVKGEFVELDNEQFYKITNSSQMPDFFMTIVSDSDHWMFLSSNGSLTAGRKNRDNALFPYYTVDKIHDSKHITGSKSCFLVDQNDQTFIWEPFTSESEKLYSIERNLYKNVFGNKIIFEEINHDLEVAFQYGWFNTEKFGFVKKSVLKNTGVGKLRISVLDGIQNLLPSGIDFDFQNTYSNLLDAYKKNELIAESRLGLFTLSSIPVDRAEPSESLRVTTVWSFGFNNQHKVLISSQQLANFRKGLPLETETDIRARRGAYFVNAELELNSGQTEDWMIVAEINQDSTRVANLNHWLLTETAIPEKVLADIHSGTENLKRIVAKADGLQLGRDELSAARHFSNTLFNVMRGGIFNSGYVLDAADFKLFVQQINALVFAKNQQWLNQLPERISHAALVGLAEKSADPDLIRMSYEYLPLTFSRRHGDPSRPWNLFSIETKNDDGTPKLNYQGNWRDIFQNWEALSFSYPEFLEGMICKFLNASTADGYNPYRVTREGIDWECPDPHDPWAYIGYWGDHQIIYLQKFLELSHDFHPGKLEEFLAKEIFVYANVPYRIKTYNEIVQNPQDTILFDAELNARVKQLTRETGADGSILRSADGTIYRVNLTEKILVSLLAKLSNFIPEAGIWLNTQRPEWNDANNALVGNGVSMVTLYYIRRFLKFWSDRFDSLNLQEIHLSAEVAALFDSVMRVFAGSTDKLKTGFSDADRRHFADALGNAGTVYRNSVYLNSFSGEKLPVQVKTLRNFTQLALEYIDQSIAANKREDGLYHAYNLISISEKEIAIRYLYEMLEGQVAVLSSGFLSVQESLDVLNALKASSLFRNDQYSYLLYPDRQLHLFVQKNTIPEEKVNESQLLTKLLADGNTSIISKDLTGNYHFNGSFRNAAVLADALNKLEYSVYGELPSGEKQKVLAIYESIFDHQSFTGRSGTFYGYEGLGSIYWHMVSKLLLAAQECFFRGVEENAGLALISRIKDHYYEIKAGIGLNKSPELYGAFPTDAYSHTPGHAGAQQPGMTGQVKEDFLSRMRELGIHFRNGELSFRPELMNPAEFLNEEHTFNYFGLSGEKKELTLKKGEMAFTFCQVPVVYKLGSADQITITFSDSKKLDIRQHVLDQSVSSKIFCRSGEVILIEVSFKAIIT